MGMGEDEYIVRISLKIGEGPHLKEVAVEILNNMTLIHRDYLDYTLLSNACIIHNLLYIDYQFCGIKNNETSIACAH